MSLVLDTGTMKYRENPNQPWRPLVIKAGMNWESMADIYDPDNGTYEVGQYVLEEGMMYRCVSEITTPETWTPAHWTSVNVGDELSSLGNTLNQLDAEKADESSLALRRSGATNTKAQIEKGTYFYLDGTLKRAIATIAQNASFTAQNCETVTDGGLNSLRIDNGRYYCKMPDGTLIQGQSVAGLSSGDTITFPEAFSASVDAVLVTPQYNTGTTIRCIFSASGITNSKFEVYAFDATTGAISTSSNLSVSWLAIGRWK